MYFTNMRCRHMHSKSQRLVFSVVISFTLWFLLCDKLYLIEHKSPHCSWIKKPKHILVTGAAGFIGHHLVMRLKEAGTDVLGTDNFNDYYDVSLKYRRSNISRLVITLDVCDQIKMKTLMTTHNFSHVVHLAGQAGVRYSLQNPLAYVNANIECFVILLEVLRDKNIPLIYASSSSVYGSNEKVPFSEDDPVDRPASLYAATKRENELLAYTYWNIYKQPSLGLRFFTVYGPLGRPDMAYYSFTKNIMEGHPITLYNNGKMSRDFTYVDDIVDGIIRTLDTCFDHMILNLGRGQPQKLMDFVHIIEQKTGKKANIKYQNITKGDVLRTFADITKAKQVLNYNPSVSLEDGMTAFVKWFNLNVTIV